MCVQRFDDSRGYADRITYRISLRSSSLWEPRHPLLKVVFHLRLSEGALGYKSRTPRPLFFTFTLVVYFKGYCDLYLYT